MKTKNYLITPSFQSIKDHTMENAIFQYVSIKIHPLITTWNGKKIIVRGCYNREESIISSLEKKGKLFNWKRPTAELSKDQNSVYINCFPGIDYVKHYAALIKTFFHINQSKNMSVVVQPPTNEQSLSQLFNTNLSQMPPHDTVIIGKIEHLLPLTHYHAWEGNSDFYWSSNYIDNQKIALLGCAFSIWGDIAGNVVHLLGQKGTKNIIYTGKLGGLSPSMQPNKTLATGDKSFLNSRTISWKNIIHIPQNIDTVMYGKHITVFSTMAETKAWFHKVGYKYSFVDPEIGHMAEAAKKQRMNFGYIHIVSDNVACISEENLSNERNQNIVEKRALTNLKILSIVRDTIKKLKKY